MALAGEVYKGASLAVSIGGTLIEQALVREVRIRESKDMLDKTGGGGGPKTFIGGERGATCSMTFWNSSKDSDLIDDISFTDDDGVAIIIYPRGNTAGEKTISFTALPTDRDTGEEKNSVSPVTVSWQISGAITRSTVS